MLDFWIMSFSNRPAHFFATQRYHGIGELSYAFHDRNVLVTGCGTICIYKKEINLSTSLADQAVGVKEVDDGIWVVSLWTMIWATSISRKGPYNL